MSAAALDIITDVAIVGFTSDRSVVYYNVITSTDEIQWR